jgi:CheY-like chemotaxis protein
MALQVLVVDDNDLFRDAMAAVLARVDVEVVHAVDGVEALAILSARAGEIKLVLVDQHMPRGGGMALVEAMDRDPALAKIPVVIISGDVDLATKRAVLRKPFDADTLLAVVRPLLGP